MLIFGNPFQKKKMVYVRNAEKMKVYCVFVKGRGGKEIKIFGGKILLTTIGKVRPFPVAFGEISGLAKVSVVHSEIQVQKVGGFSGLFKENQKS